MITAQKDLRGGNPLWARRGSGAVPTRRRLRDETCDVAVIGGGVSGALTAAALVDLGLDVVIVDRRTPGMGSTVASTAMIQFELDTPLRELSDKIGAAKANRAWRRSLRGVKDLKSLIRHHGIDCDWSDRDALYLAGNELGPKALQTEAQRRRRAGLPSAFLDADALHRKFSIARDGAILSKGAGELDPMLLTKGLLRAAAARGARIYANMEIIAIEASSDGVVLTSAAGGTVTSAKAIIATGYETIQGLPKALFDITSSWAIATEPIDARAVWPTRCLIWEAADPYLYLRATADNRILAGGEDSSLRDPKRRDAAIVAKSAALMKKIDALLPGRELTIAHAWAGAFAVSPTGLPIITELEELPNCFAILGCGGNGITFSTVASQIAAQWAVGKTDPDADLFERAGK